MIALEQTRQPLANDTWGSSRLPKRSTIRWTRRPASS